MARYRKKPVVIEAIQHNPHSEITTAYPKWFIDAAIAGTLFERDGKDFVKTLEGDMEVSDGDYIIQGVKGEIYPCKSDIFELTYDSVD